VKEEVSMHELQYEFQLRYCLSIHKSQGSEYDNVILFMGTPHKSSSWNQGHAKRLLYTAMSRTKHKCFIISNKGMLNIAQTTNEEKEHSMFF
jgi:exodeoxyribonuclease V alpha subunit